MTNFISGRKLLECWNIKDFELFDYVKNGLQPYNEIGLLLLPSTLDLSSKSVRLDELGTELEEKLNYFIFKSTFVGTIANLFNEQEYQMLEKEIEEFQKLKGELEEIENLTSWKNFVLPEFDLELSKEVINSLQWAYFKISDIQGIEKKLGLKITKQTKKETIEEPHREEVNIEKDNRQHLKTNEKPLQGYKKIAEFLGVGPDTVRQKYRFQGLEIYKQNGRVFTYPSEVNKWKITQSKKNTKKPA